MPAERDAMPKKLRVKRDRDPEKKTAATEEIGVNANPGEVALVTELKEAIEIEVIVGIETEVIEVIETETEKVVEGTEGIVEIVIEIENVKDALDIAEVVQEREDITAIVRINIDLQDMNRTIVINHKEKRNL